MTRARKKITWLDVSTLDLPARPIVDCFDDEPLEDVLLLLARVGLGEAWSYLRTPAELSDGQRWRLRLALAMHEAKRLSRDETPVVLVIDEFAALLDRITAAVVARALRRMIDASPTLGAIVATSHDDLICALQPDCLIRCDFGEIEIIEPRSHEATKHKS